MSNITLNIVEPGSGPIDPVVPNTGLFTSGIGGPEATAIGAVLVLTIAAIVVVFLYRKQKKAGKVTKLVHIIDSTKAVLKSKKRITAGLAAISLLVSACTFTAFMLNTNKNNTNAIEGEDSLTVNASDADLTIEVGDALVFAILPVDITVEQATEAGYTLTAYTDNTDLISTTDSSKVIPMVAVEGDELVALKDNTYGLSLEEPTSKDEEAYTTLSTDQDNPTIIKSMAEYSPTEAEDKTTIYYGFYITPDIPYGTYTNDSEVHYDATINTTLVTFDGNGLYFNNEEQQTTTNEVEYIAVPQENNETETNSTINQIISGEYKEPSQALPYNFLGWSEEQEATTPTYTSAEDIAQNLPILPNQPITLYAIWQRATTITFDNNGGTGTMTTQSIIAGESTNLNPNTFTREGYNFTGWNTEATPTEQTPGTPYADQAEYTAPLNKSQNLTLYAQWKVPTLYDKVQGLVKKSGGTELTQTAADLKAVITKPTSNDPSTDTSNSGVYKYDAATFGTASDASNDYTIYYYRGILDSNLDDTSESSYGSNGDGAYYPNYVRLGDTCWRIVRTTGSGGTKMIYNGSYSGGTTASSCANAQDNAQVTTSAFSGYSSTFRQVVRIGYTYNRNFATVTAYIDTIANVFGSNANPSLNNTDSTIKDYIERTWFTAAIGSYENKLEPSAGYCNDRTVYDNTSPYTQQAEDTNVVTYGTSGLAQLNFGSYVRNQIANGTRTLTLGCARNTVDLYTTSAATGGNKQLSHPVALLTADEAALAGSGGDGRTSVASNSSNYSYSSYLRSGFSFWLLSPKLRYSSGAATEFNLHSGGHLDSINVGEEAYGVRPSISLNHETTVAGGSGTATDPWTINE